MIEIFKYCASLLTAIVKKWQSMEINGFRPFWYLVGISLLTIFGFFLRGLLFSGAGGETVGKLSGGKGKSSGGSKVVIINNLNKVSLR